MVLTQACDEEVRDYPHFSQDKSAKDKKKQELSEGPDRIRLFFECLEHGVELRDLEQVLDSLGKAHQFELAPVVGYRGEPRDQLANSRAVNVGHLTEG